MGADATAIFVPGHGTYFVADSAATFPSDPLNAFVPQNPPTGWACLGHTSKDNTVAFNKDGGDKSALDTWLQDNVRTVYASTSWSLTVNMLQLDELGLDLGFNGEFDTDGGYKIPGSNNGLDRQGFLLATDGTGKLGFWMPNTNNVLGDAPSTDPTKFLELPLNVAINAAPSDKIAPMADGRAGIMKLYKTGLSQANPQITGASPASTAAAGALVTITGTGLTGTTAVKFGGTAVSAGNFLVNSDRSISAVMPDGSAGAANITVTTPAGTSNAFPYARS